ncbi:MAG: PilN domain-containing protein [Thermogutta sp.]
MTVTSYAERDFLPTEYLAQRRRRRSVKFSFAASAGLLIGLTVLSGYQYRVLAGLREEYARLLAEATGRAQAAGSLQAISQRLAQREERADWLARIAYQTPPSHVLPAVLALLPDQIVLENITWQRSPSAGGGHVVTGGMVSPAVGEDREAADQAALERLRQDLETAQVQITLQGQARELRAIHQYVMELTHSGRFDSVRLDSVEDSAETQGAGDHLFRISLTMKASPIGGTKAVERQAVGPPLAAIPQHGS